MAEAQRLDAALAERGLARSRTLAAKLIADGLAQVVRERLTLEQPDDLPTSSDPDELRD